MRRDGQTSVYGMLWLGAVITSCNDENATPWRFWGYGRMAEAGQLNRYCQKWPGKKLDFAGIKGIRVFLGKVVRIWITGSQISWWHWLQIIQERESNAMLELVMTGGN